jgi:hypothetical protein
MADLQAIFQTVNELSAEDIKELYKYIAETRMQFTDTPAPVPQPSERIFDLHAGKIWMSDDFDAELPDEFWLGEEP